MEIKSVDGLMLRRLIIAGANELGRNRNIVDALNVFPVPDGDTGTNMSLTMFSAAKEVEKCMSNDIDDVLSLCASGALKGARGNSGVILSQLIRGFYKAVTGCGNINVITLAQAFKTATETAYKAVMKPKEGTILTVASACALAAQNVCFETENICEFMEYVINIAEETLAKTTDMLPMLKEANVVDAGGMGLVFILKGAFNSIKSGKEETLEQIQTGITKEVNFDAISSVKSENIKFKYCTEFFIIKNNAGNNEIENLRKYLLSIGDSLIVAFDDKTIKVHVHSNHPGLVIEKALEIGALDGLKIDNMLVQHNNKIDFNTKKENKKYGFISVSSGDGFKEIFKNVGVDIVINGGQTMNPSTEEILNAINNVNAETIFLLPNNKNIILASEQAAELSDLKKVNVIKTKSVQEGISAMLNYDESMEEDEIILAMNEGMNFVKPLSVTFAVRDTVIDGQNINKNDYMGMIGDKIISVEKDVLSCVKNLVNKAVDDNSEIITIYYGEDISKGSAEELKSYAEEKFKNCDVELYYGGQPLYYYLISVE